MAASELRTGFRNAALANYMKSFGVLDNPVDLTLGVYFHQCAIAMSCVQLAMAGRFLALHGRNPSTGMMVVTPERARRINALMLTCGHYDGSGEFAYRVGLPGKSGVGGGILMYRARQGLDRGLVAGPRRRRQFASRPHRARSAQQENALVDFGLNFGRVSDAPKKTKRALRCARVFPSTDAPQAHRTSLVA